jgi:hypothetical protein
MSKIRLGGMEKWDIGDNQKILSGTRKKPLIVLKL